jgi:signal transduction histidine kinase/DNA-binding response OmpR family regulator
LELDDQHLALACRHGGLSIFNRSQQSFTQLVTKSRKEGDISNNDILSLHLDRKSRLWVGTSFGLNSIPLQKLKSDNSGFTVYTEKEGLPNNTVHGISEDTNGNIWISTNKGLVRLDPETGTLLKMDDKDGLQSNEFSDGSVWKNGSGEIYFGGVYGFNYGNPDTIRINTLQPNLLISNFRLGTGQQQDNGFWTISPSGQSSFRELESERDEDFFELQLRAIDYRNADKCEFAYRLEGLDNDWRYAGGNGTISYSNLSPGNYSLLVKWSNGESGWTNPVKALSLRVKPHWLLTLPAFLVYYLIAAIAIYIIYTNRKERLRIRQQLALEQQLRSHQDALYQERINFFTNIAHELQTPLTLVNGSLERMDQQGDAELTNKGGNRYLSLVRQQASRLTYLVQQLMEFRKGEDGKTSSNQDFIDVSKLVPAILNLFIEAYPGKSMQVKTTIEPGISGYADIDKLEKILYNLLSNAFKHGGNGEMLEVILQRKDNQVLIRVSNSGVNMEQGDAEKLFELFFTQSSSRHSGFSTGIGLAFTRQLTTSMGGTIDVESREGWLHFSVLLPLNQLNLSIAPGTKAINQPSPLLQSVLENTEPLSFAPATGNNKVSLLDAAILNDQKEVLLLVEDDSEIRFFLKEFLTAYYTVFEAENGKSALAWLANNSCDLIISDIMMPEMSGLEFCEQVKQNPVTCHLPVILLTARSSQDQKNEGYEAGADAYIPKPFQLQHLLVRIKSLLDTRRRMKEAVQSNVFSLPQDGTYLDEDKQLLSSLVRFVEENMENTELEAADLERFANLSKMQLYRKLKTLASMSPGEFIRTIRLQKAAHMLQHTNLTVNEIFYQTGFNNQSYFFREFKKQFGQSPGEYREKFRISV